MFKLDKPVMDWKHIGSALARGHQIIGIKDVRK